jgi:hypothetical protein
MRPPPIDHQSARTNAKPSLRALARLLKVSHSGLSEAVHRGLITRGVHVDENDRVVVVDMAAAAAQWNGRPVCETASAVTVVDRDGIAHTGQELLVSLDGHTLLVHVLVKSALVAAKPAAFIKRISTALREEARRHDDYSFDDDAVEYAERALKTAVVVLDELEDES